MKQSITVFTLSLAMVVSTFASANPDPRQNPRNWSQRDATTITARTFTPQQNAAWNLAQQAYQMAGGNVAAIQAARSRADTAYSRSGSAISSANSAYSRANSAYSRADSAYSYAGSAYSRANDGRSRAINAQNTANAANSMVNTIRYINYQTCLNSNPSDGGRYNWRRACQAQWGY